MNDKSVLQVQIYDRSIEEEVFLGFCEMRPRLVNRHTIDQWFPCVGLDLCRLGVFFSVLTFVFGEQVGGSTRRGP